MQILTLRGRRLWVRTIFPSSSRTAWPIVRIEGALQQDRFVHAIRRHAPLHAQAPDEKLLRKAEFAERLIRRISAGRLGREDVEILGGGVHETHLDSGWFRVRREWCK
jgi:hypothetical protein